MNTQSLKETLENKRKAYARARQDCKNAFVSAVLAGVLSLASCAGSIALAPDSNHFDPYETVDAIDEFFSFNPVPAKVLLSNNNEGDWDDEEVLEFAGSAALGFVSVLSGVFAVSQGRQGVQRGASAHRRRKRLENAQKDLSRAEEAEKIKKAEYSENDHAPDIL